MSEKFAYYEEENIGIHFVIETEETGEWRTYLIAINESDYDRYKDIQKKYCQNQGNISRKRFSCNKVINTH